VYTRERIRLSLLVKHLISEIIPTSSSSSSSDEMVDGVVQIGNVDDISHTYWLLPVCVPSPDGVAEYMTLRGYDVTLGASQLGCVTTYCDAAGTAEVGRKMMERLVYLPVTPEVTERECRSMVFCLRDAVLATTNPHGSTDEKILTRDNNRVKNLNTRSLVTLLISLPVTYNLIYNGRPLLTFLLLTILSRLLWWGTITITTLLSILLLFILISGRTIASKPALERSPLIKHYRDLHTERPTPVNKPPLTEMKYKLPTPTTPQTILLTGVTGFVGGLLLRDLLINRSHLKIERIILIVRPRKSSTASARVTTLLDNEIFSPDGPVGVIPPGLITTLQGDMSKPSFGLDTQGIDLLYNNGEGGKGGGIKLTKIFHAAASVSFTLPLHEAAAANITPALQAQSLARRHSAKFIYFSTAFVHGGEVGSEERPLGEEVFGPLGESYNPVKIYKSMVSSAGSPTTQSLATTCMETLNFPNTYTFSKSVAEHLLKISSSSSSSSTNNDDSSSTLVIRPSIIGPSLSSPYPGYAGAKASK